MFLHNRNILEYVEILVTDGISRILDIEGHSIKCYPLWKLMPIYYLIPFVGPKSKYNKEQYLVTQWRVLKYNKKGIANPITGKYPNKVRYNNERASIKSCNM